VLPANKGTSSRPTFVVCGKKNHCNIDSDEKHSQFAATAGTNGRVQGRHVMTIRLSI